MSNNYKAVIIDDVPISIAYLQQILSFYPEIGSIGTAENAESGEQIIMDLQPDILFLDIILADQNGFDVYKRLKKRIDWDMYVVIYSSYPEYAIEAFKYTVFAFLQKPFKTEELEEILQRFFEAKLLKEAEEKNEMLPFSELRNRCLVGTYKGSELMYVDNMLFFEYNNAINEQQWYVVLTNNVRIRLKRNTKASQIVAYSQHFVQINKRQILNLSFLSKINADKCVLFAAYQSLNGEFLVSRKYYKNLKQKFVAL
jgi:DNA-binding LytR/AlgR family response regulator